MPSCTERHRQAMHRLPMLPCNTSAAHELTKHIMNVASQASSAHISNHSDGLHHIRYRAEDDWCVCDGDEKAADGPLAYFYAKVCFCWYGSVCKWLSWRRKRKAAGTGRCMAGNEPAGPLRLGLGRTSPAPSCCMRGRCAACAFLPCRADLACHCLLTWA